MTRTPLPVLLSVLCAQAGGAVARLLFGALGPYGVAFLRLALAALILAVVLRPRVRSFPAPAVWLGVFAAGLNTLSYLGLRVAPQGVVVTASFLGPLVLALAQTRRRADLLWALVAACGVLLLALRTSLYLEGLLLGLAAGACGAGYIVCSARLGRTLGVGGLAVSFAVAALLVLPFGAPSLARAHWHPMLIAGVLAVAILSSIIPYAVELIALRHLSTRVFGVLMSLQPAAAALAGWAILGQHLGPLPLTAVLLVVTASAGITWQR